MPKAILVNMAGTQVGEVELSEAVFGIEPNQTVVHEVVKNHLANCRQGTQSALTRAEVSGGGINVTNLDTVAGDSYTDRSWMPTTDWMAELLGD